MRRLERKNDYAIKRGFRWLATVENKITERGMLAMLADSLSFALEVHDNVHFGHRTTENSFAWGLVKNGALVAYDINEGHHGSGDAAEQLKRLATTMPPDKWVGIVLADMTAERNDRKNKTIAFDEGYENEVLIITEEEAKSNYPQYFKR